MAICEMTKPQAAQLLKLYDAMEQAIADLVTFAGSIAEEWEAELEERSDKWRESANGQEAQERYDALLGWIESELPDPDMIPSPGQFL
jgi:hypothetical protein